MPVTLANLVDDIEHEAGASLDPRIDTVAIANEGGRMLFGFANWRFRSRPPALLDFVAAQGWVALPADFGFGELVSVSEASNAAGYVKQTSIDEVTEMRGFGFSPSAPPYYVALVFPTQTTVTVSAPRPRLEIHPMPSASMVGALVAVYRAGWVEMVNMTDAANVPVQFESLLRRVVRAKTTAYAKGNYSVLESIEGSNELQRLKRTDAAAMVQSEPMRGGVMQRGYWPGRSWNHVVMS